MQRPAPASEKAVYRAAGEGTDKASHFRIFAGATEFGAAWNKTARQGCGYVSVGLYAPQRPSLIPAGLAEAEDGENHAPIWSRRSGD